MLVIRDKKTAKIENLYYVSNISTSRRIILPTIPNNFLTRGKFQDDYTPRVRLYTNIDDALSCLFLGQNLENTRLNVYRARSIRPENLIGPVSITSVPYALLADEWWYLVGTELEKIKEIEVLDKNKSEYFKYGKRATKQELIRWNWKEIEKDDYKKKK